MKHWVGQNLSLIIMSTLLAFFFWAVATEAENPTIENTYTSPIPIDIRGLSEDRVWYDLDSNRARVELRAPQSVWDNLDADDIVVYIDLSKSLTGTVTVPVQAEIRVNPVRILSVSPAEVTLHVETIAQKEFPISLSVKGVPALGYRMETAQIAPQSAQVQGPASFVAQVAEVQTSVSIQGQQADVRSDYELIPVDQAGNKVSNVDISPKNVTVNVPIRQLGYMRDLAVSVTLEGQPAPGYRIADLEVIPPVVKVFGRTDVVRDAPGLQTQSINMDGITTSLTTTVALQMFEGLSVIFPPSPYVTVSLSIEAIKSGLKLDLTPVIRGLHRQFTATIGIESVVVILDGPLTIMDTLPVTDVQVILDLTNLTPGDYNLTPTVIIPNGVTLQNLLPETIPVEIEELVLPTPTPTPTPEGTPAPGEESPP